MQWYFRLAYLLGGTLLGFVGTASSSAQSIEARFSIREMNGRGVGIEPITQSNSTAPEHRRAALLRRVCKGTRHPRMGAAEQPSVAR
jgi:hypothetical protein